MRERLVGTLVLRCVSPVSDRDPVNKATPADVWAIALSEDGQYLAGVTQDGHIKVWDLDTNGEEIRDYETKGSFGTCIDLVGEDSSTSATVGA